MWDASSVRPRPVRELWVVARSLALHTGHMAVDTVAITLVTGAPDSSAWSSERSMSNGRGRPTAPAIGASFDEVVLPHLDAAYRLARRLTRNEYDAEDVVQETSLRAFQCFRTFSAAMGRLGFSQSFEVCVSAGAAIASRHQPTPSTKNNTVR
jgi:Sigma-70 region 2